MHDALTRPPMRANRWIKASLLSLFASITVGSFALTAKIAVSKQEDAATVALMLLIVTAMVFMFLARIYRLCLVVLDQDGVSRGKLRWKWDEVSSVYFKNFSFFFVGLNGTKIELHTGLHADHARATREVYERLPERLKLELNNRA
jgi:hypothetical protein